MLVFTLQVYSLFCQGSLKPLEFLHQTRWTVENGLPVDSVMSIAQTPDGYLWAGTEAGLARFDGIKFTVFTPGSHLGPSPSMVIDLLADRGGALWMATRDGGVVRYKDARFDWLKEPQGLKDNDVWCLMEDMDGAVWIGSRGGLNRFARETLTSIELPENLESHFVQSLMEDRHGRIWVGTSGGGLLLVKKHTGGFEFEHLGLDKDIITTLFEDRVGAVWVGTAHSGLWKFQGNQRFVFSTTEGLPNPDVRCLHEDRFGNLWIGSLGGGISILPAGSNRVVPYPNREEFVNKNVIRFFRDREGILWIATEGDGLVSLRETKITTYTMKHGLSHHNIFGVFQDSLGRVWAGTKGYGVNYFYNGRFHNLTTGDGLSSDAVVTMTEDRDGNLWFGTLGGGINRYRDGKVDVFTTRHGLSYNFFRAIYAEPDGTVWAGAVNGGIHRFDNGGFEKVADIKFRVNCFHRDMQGYLWIGTLGGGLCRMKDGGIEILDHRNGLSSNIIADIHEDRDGTIWVGTIKGLNRYKDGKFEVLNKQSGLPDEVIYSILADHKGNFWIGSNRGIYWLGRADVDDFFNGKRNRVSPTVYGREAGMRALECNGGNEPPGWRTDDGKLWFPTTRGISVIDPMNLGVNKIPPPVVIERVTVDGTSYPAETHLEIPYNSGSLDIEYTGLSFIVPEKMEFEYQLEGFDETRVNAGNRRSAEYRKIPPGRYRFHVTACNSDGVWNETGAAVEIYLKPAFYQTVIFKIFMLLLGVGLLAAGFYFAKKYLQFRPTRPKQERNPTLSQEDTTQYVRKLLYLLEAEKVYKDPNLTIKSLASKMVMTQRNLSIIINDQLQTNFYEFINRYRIQEAKQLLSGGETVELSILDIAYEVGYNSKSAFYRAFSHFTDMTPSQFRKKQKK